MIQISSLLYFRPKDGGDLDSKQYQKYSQTGSFQNINDLQVLRSRRGRGGAAPPRPPAPPPKVFWQCALFFEELFIYAFFENI